MKMRIEYITIFLIILSSCCTRSVLTRNNYINMSDQEIREIFLDHIPIGSTREFVKETLKNEFCRTFNKFDNYKDREKFYVYEKILTDDQFQSSIERDDFKMITTLKRYGWAKNLFLAGEIVEALWLFDENEKLKDITIIHTWDGI